jgi:hypothetical protein
MVGLGWCVVCCSMVACFGNRLTFRYWLFRNVRNGLISYYTRYDPCSQFCVWIRDRYVASGENFVNWKMYVIQVIQEVNVNVNWMWEWEKYLRSRNSVWGQCQNRRGKIYMKCINRWTGIVSDPKTELFVPVRCLEPKKHCSPRVCGAQHTFKWQVWLKSLNKFVHYIFCFVW